MAETPAQKVPEFSRVVVLGELPEGGRDYALEANAEERGALARRFDLPAIGLLRATVQVVPLRGRKVGGAAVSLGLSARVTQVCVLSLEPFEVPIEERAELRVLPPELTEGETDFEAAEAADSELLEGDRLDLGELVAQHLAVALDPYPKRPGVRFEVPGLGPAPGEGRGGGADKLGAGPFAALGELKRKM
jgi:uncharacterized metal-binding protein YceD (DUF177 family)